MIDSLITRPVDKNNRCALPKDLTRAIFHVEDGESFCVKFYHEDDAIIIKKAEPSCVFCNNHDANILQYKGKTICSECLKEIIKSQE